MVVEKRVKMENVVGQSRPCLARNVLASKQAREPGPVMLNLDGDVSFFFPLLMLFSSILVDGELTWFSSCIGANLLCRRRTAAGQWRASKVSCLCLWAMFDLCLVSVVVCNDQIPNCRKLSVVTESP